MKTSEILKATLLLVPAIAWAEGNNEQKKTNIVFILSGDAGYADFGFQGSKQFETPNLDKLAENGMILHQMYTTDAVSGPSRAGLMTGRYQQRFGIEENNVVGYMSKHGKYGLDMGVPTSEKFISNYLSEAGYVCGAFGKWHLGATDEYHPYRRGFDQFVGFRSGGRNYYPYQNEEESFADEGVENRLEYGFAHFKEPDKYMTYLLADEACKFIEENAKKPFFVYLAFNAVHAPLQAEKEDLAKFAHLKGKRKSLAAMAWAMDKACGQVFDKLKELGLDKNTIIVFTNDNGGPNGTETSNYPLSGMKATFLEGGVRVPAIISYPGVIKKGSHYNKPTSFLDFLPAFINLAGYDKEIANPLDGVDIIPYLTGKNNGRPHQTLYWKIENRGVVRDGDWKFMRFPDRPAELYDISKDEGEQNNLADKHPDLIRKYYKMLSDWEMTLDRPMWMLERKYEKRVLEQFYEQEEYRRPKEYK